MAVSDFGRIGRDGELRYTQGGTAVCGIPVAVEYGQKGQDGRRPTQWYEVTLWGKQAEGLSQYLTKGKQVFFTADDLRVETFQKNDGTQGVKLVCRCMSIKFARDGQQAGQAPQRPPEAQQPARQQSQAQQAPSYESFDDDK